MRQNNVDSVETSAARRHSGPLMAVFVLLARVGGVVLLVVGIGTMTRVAFEIWGLYQEPAKIVRFAEAIEKGSNIDKVLLPHNRAAGGSGEQSYEATGNDLKPSYFLAWVVVIPLLLAVGVVALWATKAGAELTIHGWPQERSRR